uniref:Reverse transcriptase domain-containing protein n=1 Tax=Tanacetum cinerariifolium TaxID=118510 RepID=A0A6L2L0N8_TANCI|nr:reverse transcriptase domain-containing protein [Tanacetum cinerariifolium]
MQTRSSSKLSRDQTSNPTSSTYPTPKGQIRRSSKQKVENSNFEEYLPPIAMMTDNRIMTEMLHAPTEGCAKAIMVPSILAEQFELKHSLINMMTSEQFFGLEKDNPHDHIRWGSPPVARKRTPAFEIAKLTHAVNQQTSVVTTAMTAMLKQLQANPPPAQVKTVEEICVTCGGAHPYYQYLAAGGNTLPEFQDNIQGYVSAAASNYNQGNPDYRPQGVANQMQPPGNTVANPKGKLKAITTRSGLVTDGPTVPTPPKSVTLEEDECVEETYTNPDLAEYTIKVPPSPVQKHKPPFQRHFVHTRDSPLSNIPYPSRMLKQKQQEKDEIQIQKFCHKFKQLHLNITLAEALLTLSLLTMRWDPRVPLILGRPFLRTARALIDVRGEEMILYDGDERLTLNMKHDTASYSNHPHRESVNLIHIFNVSSEDCLEDSVSNQQSGNLTLSLHKEIALPKVTHEIHDSEGCKFLSEELPNIDSFNDIHPHFDDNPLSEDSDLKDSIDQTDLANLDDYFVDPTPEMFNDEHAPDYLFPLRFDVYDDDFLEIESDADNFYDDPFDSKREKIKESKLLIDELDLPCDFLPNSKYDSFNSHDFSKDDDFPSPNNEDKVFNPGILIQEESVTIITRVAQEKKLAISKASLVFEDFDPPFYEPLVFKDVPNSMMILLFSSENEEKVFKPGIYTSEKVHFCFLFELSHPAEDECVEETYTDPDHAEYTIKVPP